MKEEEEGRECKGDQYGMNLDGGDLRRLYYHLLVGWEAFLVDSMLQLEPQHLLC